MTLRMTTRAGPHLARVRAASASARGACARPGRSRRTMGVHPAWELIAGAGYLQGLQRHNKAHGGNGACGRWRCLLWQREVWHCMSGRVVPGMRILAQTLQPRAAAGSSARRCAIGGVLCSLDSPLGWDRFSRGAQPCVAPRQLGLLLARVLCAGCCVLLARLTCTDGGRCTLTCWEAGGGAPTVCHEHCCFMGL